MRVSPATVLAGLSTLMGCCILILVVALGVAACSLWRLSEGATTITGTPVSLSVSATDAVATATLYPTYTPYPTYTQRPTTVLTSTPRPTAIPLVPPTPTPEQSVEVYSTALTLYPLNIRMEPNLDPNTIVGSYPVNCQLFYTSETYPYMYDGVTFIFVRILDTRYPFPVYVAVRREDPLSGRSILDYVDYNLEAGNGECSNQW